MPYLGAHESISGGLHLAFERILQVEGEALQIFTRNQRQWKSAPLSDEEISLFKEGWEKAHHMPVASHASYLINLASGKTAQAEKSIDAFVQELMRCQQLDIEKVVIHPGSHGGNGIDVGLQRVATNLDNVFELAGDTNQVRVLLETTAGQGTGLGHRFEELAAIREASRFSERIGFCFDTCHVFAAGYDIRTQESYMQVMQEWDEIIGCEHLQFFHLNDSKKELGSHVDRHEHIGKGCIGLEGFRALLNDPRFTDRAMTLETPKEKDLEEDRQNLSVLRSLLIRDS